MKNIIKTFITILLTFIIALLVIYYNIKIIDVENGNITIDVLGLEQVYHFEK